MANVASQSVDDFLEGLSEAELDQVRQYVYRRDGLNDDGEYEPSDEQRADLARARADVKEGRVRPAADFLADLQQRR